MSIKSLFDIQKPDDVVMRLTMTMKLSDWKKVRETLSTQSDKGADYWHPAAEAVRLIGEMVRQAETAFYGSASETDKE